jgi:hypothetical protein
MNREIARLTLKKVYVKMVLKESVTPKKRKKEGREKKKSAETIHWEKRVTIGKTCFFFPKSIMHYTFNVFLWGKSWARFLMSLDFSIDLILPVALWSLG